MKTPPQTIDVKSASFSKRQVQAALKRDGAVVLSNVFQSSSCNDDSWKAVAAQVPPRFVVDADELLLGSSGHAADAVHKEHEQLSLSGKALPPHSDGYIWGDKFPDLVILVCEESAATVSASLGAGTPDENKGGKEEEPPATAVLPGANYLIDGYDIVEHLKPETRSFLETVLVDHTERASPSSDSAADSPEDVGGSFVNGAESIVPVFRWLDPEGWRKHGDDDNGNVGRGRLHDCRHLCWRRMVNKDCSAGYGEQTAAAAAVGEHSSASSSKYMSLWAPVDSDAPCDKKRIHEALREVDHAISSLERASARFCLHRGQALIVDNFRMLHAREAFLDPHQQLRRRMWRVWSWTNASFGLPPQLLEASCKEEGNRSTDAGEAIAPLPPANILDAEQSIIKTAC